METRVLGRTGRPVSVIGLGMRGLAARRTTADAARALILALEHGVTLIDVAPGWSDALRLAGETVRTLRMRDDAVVASLVPPLAGGAVERALPAGYVQKAVEDALRASRLDAIPLVWLGDWRNRWLLDRGWPELRGMLERLIREGKAMAWGAAWPDTRDPRDDDAPSLLDEPGCAAIQVRRSLFDRSGDEVIAAAARAGVAVIAREPLARGVLAGEVAPGMKWPIGDERARWEDARLEAIVPDLARLAALVTATPPAARATTAGRALVDDLRRAPDLEHASLAELALRFVIDRPEVTALVVGARSAEHVRTAVACGDGRRIPARIAAALAARVWGEAWYATGVLSAP